jgi:hypothetical protein
MQQSPAGRAASEQGRVFALVHNGSEPDMVLVCEGIMPGQTRPYFRARRSAGFRTLCLSVKSEKLNHHGEEYERAGV